MTAPAQKLRVVHVSADYPDAIAPHKTAVIRTLRDLVADRFEQHVVSLNRVAPALSDAGPILRQEVFAHGTAIAYAAPPLGLFHCTMLDRLGDALAEPLSASARPDLIVGHKLTVEGIAVARCAKRLGIPYAITIQGNTDTKIVDARPDLRRRFASILDGAGQVFCFAPWAWHALEKKLPVRKCEPVMLPCPTPLDAPLPPQRGDGTLASVFNLNNWRGKNLPRMAQALDAISCDARLAVIGGGEAADERVCRAIAARQERLVLEGPVSHDRLPQRLNRACGFILPSRRESFGLVFVEALFAGLPIAYPKGRAVDGWFDGLPFALKVDPSSISAIAAAMDRLVAAEADFKAALAEWQDSPEAKRFTRPAIAESFAAGLARAAGA
jgi:glycosyltransferase involved in cell wall biosynthesis